MNLQKLLPTSLWFLLQVAIASTQTTQKLSQNSLSSFSPSSLGGTTAFSLPKSSQLSVSVAICTGTIQSTTARFYLTNNSAISVPGSGGGHDVYNIPLNEGFGNWTGPMLNGGTLAVEHLGQSSFEIGVSTNGVMHQALDVLPFLGDTTSSQALIFSPSFSPIMLQQPTYPNYTLPVANMSQPTQPSSIPNYTLVLSTTSNLLTNLPQTGCSLLSAPGVGIQGSQDLWLRDEEGWRMQWLMENLTPQTNYTAYVIQQRTKVSGPIYLVTKSASFPCPLVHSLPYCPSTAYAVPLPQPQPPNIAYTSINLPSQISNPLLQYTTNFTTMLLTFACGRDLYSPLQTCADCQRAYRKWLCNVSFPRCSEASPSSSGSDSPQVPMSALAPQPSGPSQRNQNLPPVNSPYDALLPCLETCHAVERACPHFLGIKCPVSNFNAVASYGVGYIDNGISPQDRWGNIWCNES